MIHATEESNGIFFGVITTPNSQNQKFVYDAWIKNLRNYSSESRVAFITSKGKEIQDVLYLHPPEELEILKNSPGGQPRDKDIVIKRLLGAIHFVENTNLNWYWSLSDDCLLKLKNINYIVNYLNLRYNPLIDSHIEGHCIEANNHIYMQGGCGYILSRKAAEIFIKNGISLIKNITSFDDLEFGKMRDILGVSVQQSASKFIYGHKFTFNVNEDLYNTLEYCPSSIPYSKCYGRKLFDINNFTAFHTNNVGGQHFLPKNLKTLEIIQKQGLLHPDISYYYDSLYLHFCKKRVNIPDFF